MVLVDWSATGLPVLQSAASAPATYHEYRLGDRPGQHTWLTGKVLDLGYYRGHPALPQPPALPPRNQDPRPPWAPTYIDLPLPHRAPDWWHFPAWTGPHGAVPEVWLLPVWDHGEKKIQDPYAIVMIWVNSDWVPHQHGCP